MNILLAGGFVAVLVVASLAAIGPVLAAVILAIQLNRRAQELRH